MAKAIRKAKVPENFKLSAPSKISLKNNSSINFPAGPSFSCPGATEACSDCYAKKHRHLFGPVQKNIADNWKLLSALEKSNQMTKAIDSILSGMQQDLGIFRINSSGDFSSQWVVDMWAKLIGSKKDTQFWAYTRSFDFNFSKLTRLPNFSLWASTDDFNFAQAKEFVRRFRKSGTKHAYGPWDHDRPFPKNSFCCPVTSGDMKMNGACEKCMLCVTKRRTSKHVVFLKH